MKKVIVSLLFLSMTYSVFSQDIIVTKKAEKISAKVEEVGVDVVKYKKMDNLTGPSYTIKKSEIASIIYKNGTVDVFAEEEKAEVKKEVQKEAPAPSPNVGMSNVAGKLIETDGRDFRFIGTYTKMSKWEYQDYLQVNCPKAYSAYSTGRGLYSAGTAFIIIGTSLTTSGFAIWWFVNMGAGSAMWITGLTLTTISIPLLIVGSVLKKRVSVNVHNDYMKERGGLSLDYSVGVNNLGLTLHF
jgi:hypothetical protein